MPITLITGIPRHGKTTLLVEKLMASAKEGKRPIYAGGINGLAPGLAEPLNDPREWNAIDPNGPPTCRCPASLEPHAHVIPNGSIIYIDECWQWFGHLTDASRAPPPRHVQLLAIHGHRELDLVMTTQQTNQIYPFMRGLIGEHIHVVRNFMTKWVTDYSWPRCCDDVDSPAQKAQSTATQRMLSAEAHRTYTSASGHENIKVKFPWRTLWIPAMVVAAFTFTFYAYAWLKHRTASRAEVVSAGGASVSGVVGNIGASKFTTAKEWANRLVPRIPGVHGSEPIFDDRKVATVPATYCVISGQSGKDAVSCHCYTEQATRIDNVDPAVCRTNAREGLYDPFRAPPVVGVPAIAYVAPQPLMQSSLSGTSPTLKGKPYIGTDYVPPGQEAAQ